KDELLHIVTEEWESPHSEAGARGTIASGWSSGAAKPLTIAEDEWPDVEKTVEELNRKFFAVRKYGGRCRGCSVAAELIAAAAGARSGDRLAAQTFDNFQLGYANRKIQVGEKRGGEPILEDAAAVWLEHPRRREYERVVFLPGAEAPPDQYNLWRGFH